MCCIVGALAVFGPRLAIIIWWLEDRLRWDEAFSSAIWPILGFLFVPWTTLAWVWADRGGFGGFWDYLVLGIGIALDVMAYSGNAAKNRDSLPAYR